MGEGGYWSRAFSFAWAETVHVFGWGRKRIVVAVLAIGSFFMYRTSGAPAMLGEWQVALAYVLAGSGGAFLLLLLWNLLRAPAQMEKDKNRIHADDRENARARISELEVKVSQLEAIRPELECRLNICIWGGHNEQFPNETVLILHVAIPNIGTMASIATDFLMELNLSHSVLKRGLTYVRELRLQTSPQHPQIQIKDTDLIFNVASTPISIGGMAQGYAIGVFPSDILNDSAIGATVTLSFSDVKKRRYYGTYKLEGGQDTGYAPGMLPM